MLLQDDLLTMLTKNEPSAAPEDAQRTLATALETLGYLLSAPLVRELQKALPRPCSAALALGRRASDSARRLAHAHAPCEPAELPGPLLHQLGEVCGTLAAVLPDDLVHRMDRELPQPLTGIFKRYAASVSAPPSHATVTIAEHVVTRE